jgi:hypothetical protein
MSSDSNNTLSILLPPTSGSILMFQLLFEDTLTIGAPITEIRVPFACSKFAHFSEGKGHAPGRLAAES